MEALWNLEDKWKVSTQEACQFLLLVCTVLVAVGLCAVAVARRMARQKRRVSHELGDEPVSIRMHWEGPGPGCGRLKKVLMRSVRWSGASKWGDGGGERWRVGMPPLLVTGEWPSHNSASPVWQRPILMGEKCELPRFSGLILYDERGQPLPQYSHQENRVVVGRTTLKDLL
ncbi:uncharacterized protein LOC131148838 [Malania oleifera]|uniref:uncharacterized protein LOC131148838 n=1 Tax=Malania oleifera TaxID=397392 RepID=UPI0025AE661D|nr:uncharacterized protein LOC131148838 [Malania oleifera]